MTASARLLVIAALVTASSVFAGAGLMMGGILSLLIAALLALLAAALMRRYVPGLRAAPRYWSGCSAAAAFMGKLGGLMVGTWSAGGILHTPTWQFQPTLAGLGAGLFIGVTQWLCAGSLLPRPLRWVALATISYGLGAGIVDQPVRSLGPAFVLSYALVFLVLVLQTRGFTGGKQQHAS